MSFGAYADHPPFIFRLNENGLGPELLRQVFLERGWLEFDEETHCDYDWNLWWRTSRFRTSDYDTVYPWQRLNHYPKSTLITKKDTLARNLKRMRCVHGANVFNFSPLSFNLPNDYTKYVKAYGAFRQKDGKSPLWICKPADLSRGRGIFIFRDLSELMYDCNAVVQHYIENPLLIGGYKFDLRIYVAVVSFLPLTVYIHEEGIVRFSTEKFDLNSTKNVFAHLTNTSINKHSPGYTEDKDKVGPGCKWTLTHLRLYFIKNNINDQMLWRRIVNIVILTLLVQAPQVQKVDNCFELYGFDILVDENLKPWLLEVNFSPALSADCQADVIAKKPMLHDLLDLLRYKSKDAERGGEEFRHYYQSFAGQPGNQWRDSILQKAANQGRRTGRQGFQGRKLSRQRVSSAATDSSAQGEIANLGLPLAGKLSKSQDEDAGEEKTKGEVAFSVNNSKHEAGKVASTENFSFEAGRNYVEEALDSVMDQALTDAKMLIDPEQRGPPYRVSKANSKTVSTDTHSHAGGSGDSKVSKASTDSGIGSINKSGNSSAKSPHGRSSSSLPEMFPHGRLGSGVYRREGTCGEEVPLQLPSLQSNASSKRARKSVLTPRSLSENLDQLDKNGPHPETLHQTRSKSVSMKSLLSIGNGRSSHWQNPLDDSGPMTHRSIPSISRMSGQSRMVARSRRTTQQRNQSSMSYHPGTQAASKFMQPHPRQQKFYSNKGTQHGSFSSMTKKVGNFHLVFPFNEVTYKVALTTLDAKVVIRETQCMIREALSNVSNSRASADHNGFNDSFCKDSDELWSTLRAPKDDL